MSALSALSLKDRAVEYIKNYISLNFGESQSDLFKYLNGENSDSSHECDDCDNWRVCDNWIDEHFVCPEVAHTFEISTSRDIVEAINYSLTKSEFTSFNSPNNTVEDITLQYLHNVLLNEFSNSSRTVSDSE